MNNILVVVDMQNDFLTGSLKNSDGVSVIAGIADKLSSFDGRVIFTRDTHGEDYLSTQEGRRLPVEHCIRGTRGWEICPELEVLRKEEPVDKPTFGSIRLGELLAQENRREKIDKVTLVGVCTDICVISNALILKAFLPETEIAVDASLCAGTAPENHKAALTAMKSCQVTIENE